MAAASAFAQTLRRYTSLNHLAQAARAVLQNTAQINQMLSDLNRVDFANVQVTESLLPWQIALGAIFWCLPVCPQHCAGRNPLGWVRAADPPASIAQRELSEVSWAFGFSHPLQWVQLVGDPQETGPDSLCP